MGLPLKALRPNDGQGVTTALVAGAVRMHWVGAIDIPAQCDAIISAATSGVRSCNSDLERLYLTSLGLGIGFQGVLPEARAVDFRAGFNVWQQCTTSPRVPCLWPLTICYPVHFCYSVLISPFIALQPTSRVHN